MSPPAKGTDAAGPGFDPVDRLRAHRLRATPQRRAILDAFRGGGSEHLSAEEIHARAAARVPGISRGTVYATLADLSEVGILSSVGNQEPVRYETNVAAHAHFRCDLCLRLFDIALTPPGITTLANDGYDVRSTLVVAEGTCKDCGAFSQGLQDGTVAVLDTHRLGEDVLSTLSCVRHDTPVGPLLFAASVDGIVRIAFEDHADFGPMAVRARSRRGGREARDRVSHLIDGVDCFFAGEHEPMSDLVDWNLVGATSRLSLESTREIAWGRHRSYHEICDDPLDPYQCGWLMGSNPVPLFAPCHRLLCGQASLTAYVGGLDVRDELRELEQR